MARRSTVSVKVVLNPALLNPFLVDVTNASARRAAGRVKVRAGLNVMAAGRVRTGALAAGFTMRKVDSIQPHTTTYQVSSTIPYAGFQEEGIGPQQAAPGKVFRFKPKGSGIFVFARRTRGFKGGHFLRNAYRVLTTGDFLP